ncbi:MAG: hypothetical protein QNL62_08825 [Gammaproteobacteria bacterium]|nr:hypothetical protein [Gammaproteobacteria bacterium]
MKTPVLCKKMFAAVILAGFIFPLVGQAGQMPDRGCTKRPLSDFLDAQGTTEYFYPPAKDMLAWTDLEFVNFALVDYAGLANDYLASSLGTEVKGRVLECVGRDGTVTIKVLLSTENALGFAQSVADLFASDFDFLNTPTIFGAKAQDVLNGAEPAIGHVRLKATFTIENSGDDLPDIRIMYQEQLADHLPATIDLRSTTEGTLPDGTEATLHIQQVAETNEAGELVFSREIVDIKMAD